MKPKHPLNLTTDESREVISLATPGDVCRIELTHQAADALAQDLIAAARKLRSKIAVNRLMSARRPGGGNPGQMPAL